MSNLHVNPYLSQLITKSPIAATPHTLLLHPAATPGTLLLHPTPCYYTPHPATTPHTPTTHSTPLQHTPHPCNTTTRPYNTPHTPTTYPTPLQHTPHPHNTTPRPCNTPHPYLRRCRVHQGVIVGVRRGVAALRCLLRGQRAVFVAALYIFYAASRGISIIRQTFS